MTRGEKIKAARTKKGLSQAQLAQIIGVSQQAIALFEADKNKGKYNTLRKLSNVLQIDLLERDKEDQLTEEERYNIIESAINDQLKTTAEERDSFELFLTNHGTNIFIDLNPFDSCEEENSEEFTIKANVYVSFDKHTYKVPYKKWNILNHFIYEISKNIIELVGEEADNFEPKDGVAITGED